MNPEPTGDPSANVGIKFRMTQADGLVAVGALIILLFSWGSVVSYNIPDALRRLGVSDSDLGLSGTSLWSYLRPLGIFVILAALILLATALIDVWWKRDEAKVGVNRHHLQVGLALFVLVDIFGMGLTGGDGVSMGWGAIVQLLGALIATAGAVLNHLNQLQTPLPIPVGGSSKPAPTYPATQYSPGQVPVQPTDPAAPTAQMPAQDPNNPNS
jgi:hypothetical protein